MHTILTLLIFAVLRSRRDRAALQLELITLRHRLAVLERKRTTRTRLTRIDRFFWVWLYRLWPGPARVQREAHQAAMPIPAALVRALALMRLGTI